MARKAKARQVLSQGHSLAGLSRSLSWIQHAKGGLPSSLMSALHRTNELPPSPFHSGKVSLSSEQYRFSGNICQLSNEHTLRKLWTFEDHLNTVGSPSFASPLLSLSLLSSSKKNGTATWHFPSAPYGCIITHLCLWWLLMCFDLSFHCSNSWNLSTWLS